MTTYENKVALVTGASRGLGLVLTRELVIRGWHVIINARKRGLLHDTARQLAEYGRITPIAGDVTDPEHRIALASAAQAAGGLDAVVNNAGILGPSPQPDLFDYPLEVLEQVYLVNVVAPLAVLQAVRHLLKPDARIINVTSDAAVAAYEGWGGYGSSKAALEQLTAVLAVENPLLNVFSVDPGDMRTEMHQEAFPHEDISDLPLPEASVPGFIALLEGEWESGRYQARQLLKQVV
jgi:NAD(P)-dependent dehydrogenase (short-subunit alcohol dehydrogenase family)